MTYAPFVVDSNGEVRNLNMEMDANRVYLRQQMLAGLSAVVSQASGANYLEDGFISTGRWPRRSASDHAKVLDKTLNLMTSKQMEAFKVNKEPQAVRDRYGNTASAAAA